MLWVCCVVCPSLFCCQRRSSWCSGIGSRVSVTHNHLLVVSSQIREARGRSVESSDVYVGVCGCCMLLVVIGLTVAAKATEVGGALCGSSGGGALVVVLVVGSGLVMIGLGACRYTGAAVLVVDLGGALKVSPDVFVGLQAFVALVGAGCCA